MPRIAAIVITKNEAQEIADCLQTLDFCHQIWVVDAESTDATAEIARRYTPQVVVRPWQGYARARNWAIDQATGDWILALDADERVSPSLRKEILETLDDPPADAYLIPRRLYFCGSRLRHGGSYPDRQLRLFKRGSGRYNDRLVHESVEVSGKVEKLSQPIIHHSHRDLGEYLEKARQYGRLAGKQRYEQGRRARWYYFLMPGAEFIHRYLFRLGFLDGLPGLLYCTLCSWQTWLKYAWLWELERRAAISPESR